MDSARREHAVHPAENLYEKPMIEIFTYRVYYKGERCGESETVLCRRRITKKAAGLPSFDKKRYVMGCRLFFLNLAHCPLTLIEAILLG